MKPIGIYDSGVGGISVLKEAMAMLPHEDFVYYGDNLNAPYGTKQEAAVRAYAREAAGFFVARQAKAIVIACNTATSAAAEHLRSLYDFPIIGMEPALKPASCLRHGGKVLVMATPLTLSLPKFKRLMALYGEQTIPLPCPGLMEFAERGIISGPELERFINKLIEPIKNEAIDAVVLGCTHYIFLRKTLEAVFPKGTSIVDGNEGTVRQLAGRLAQINALNPPSHTGTVRLFTSGDASSVISIMERLLYGTNPPAGYMNRTTL